MKSVQARMITSKFINILKCRKIEIQVHLHIWPYSFIRHATDKEVYFLCCDQKARTASAQSFTMWQQAIIEITRRDHSIIACSRHIYLCVAFCAHPICDNRTFNATSTERLQQRPLLFAVSRTYRTFFLWRLHLAPPSHPGQSTTLLWLESPDGKYAKLHTVAARNNRDPASCSFYFCLFVWRPGASWK